MAGGRIVSEFHKEGYMITLTMLSMVLGGFMLLLCYLKIKQVKNDAYAGGAVLIIFLASFALGGGIAADIFGTADTWAMDAMYVALIAGSLSMLGLSAIASYISPFIWGFIDYSHHKQTGGLNTISLIMEIVGFIASILGIISFLLDDSANEPPSPKSWATWMAKSPRWKANCPRRGRSRRG